MCVCGCVRVCVHECMSAFVRVFAREREQEIRREWRRERERERLREMEDSWSTGQSRNSSVRKQRLDLDLDLQQNPERRFFYLVRKRRKTRSLLQRYFSPK